MKMSITFSFPIWKQLGGNFQSDILLSRGGLKSTLIQARRLDIFFGVRPSSRDESMNTTSKGTGAFIQLIRAKERVGWLTDLGGFRDVGIFDKVFNFISGMGSARAGQRKRRRKSNRRGRGSGSHEWEDLSLRLKTQEQNRKRLKSYHFDQEKKRFWKQKSFKDWYGSDTKYYKEWK